MRHFLLIFLFILSVNAFASSCPNGYIALEKNNYTLVAAKCASNHTDIGALTGNCASNPTICMPEIVCSVVSTLKTENGLSLPLYSVQYTTPTIKIKVNDTVCYANLLAGVMSDTINIKYSENAYHVVMLRRCLAFGSATVPVSDTPSANTVAWTASAGDTKISGISHCGAISGSVGTTQAAITINDASSVNKHCWCRIIHPSPSAWTFGVTYDTNSACDTYCVQKCAEMFSDNFTFRNALMSTMAI